MATNVAAIEDHAGKGARRALGVALWVAQALLALAFGMSGFMKTTQPLPELAHRMAWVSAVPGPLVRFIGVAELAGALGLLLPSLTRVRPRLTPLAAAGLTTIMVLAGAFHLSRSETPFIKINFVLGALAAFVAWGRLRGAPIAPRP